MEEGKSGADFDEGQKEPIDKAESSEDEPKPEVLFYFAHHDQGNMNRSISSFELHHDGSVVLVNEHHYRTDPEKEEWRDVPIERIRLRTPGEVLTELRGKIDRWRMFGPDFGSKQGKKEASRLVK